MLQRKMMSSITLYKALLREAQKFSSYNFRMYALRRIRDSFKENRTLTSHEDIEKQVMFGEKNLAMIRRQVVVGNLYSTEKLVIEKSK